MLWKKQQYDDFKMMIFSSIICVTSVLYERNGDVMVHSILPFCLHLQGQKLMTEFLGRPISGNKIRLSL